MKNQKKILQRRVSRPYIHLRFNSKWHLLFPYDNNTMTIKIMLSTFVSTMNAIRRDVISIPLNYEPKAGIDKNGMLTYLEDAGDAVRTKTSPVTIRISPNFPQELIDL